MGKNLAPFSHETLTANKKIYPDAELHSLVPTERLMRKKNSAQNVACSLRISLEISTPGGARIREDAP